MNKFLLAVFLAITILYISPLEASAGDTGTFFSVQYASGYGHDGGFYKAGYGHGHGHKYGHRYRHKYGHGYGPKYRHRYGYHRGYRHHHGGSHYYWKGTFVIPWHPYGYYSPPPVVIQKQPPVYVQPEQQEEKYWYYCPDPQGYYPYIRNCESGWMKVVPDATPPNP